MPGKKIVLKAVFRGVDKMSGSVSRMQRGFKRFTSSARRGLKRLSRATKGLRRAIGRGLKIGIVSATAALAGMAYAINRVAGKLDILGKQATRLDFPVEELQEWGFVAQQSGIDQAEFTKGLDTFAKAVGEAKMGQGALTTVLKKNNRPLLRQIKGAKDTAEAFRLYTQAMREQKDPLKRVAMGALAFGRAGKKMANVAKLTTKEVEALRKEQRQNGVATEKTVRNAEKFNDAMNSAKLMVMGFLFDAMGPLLPELKDMLRQFREWGIRNKEIARSKIKETVLGVVQGVKDLYKWFSKFNEEHKPFEKFGQAARAIGNGISFIADNFQTIVNILRIGLPILLGFKTALFLMTTAETLKGLAGLSSSISGIGTQASSAKGKVGKLTGALGVLAAGAMGWQIGSIIHEQVLGPLAKANEDLRILLESARVTAEQVIKTGTITEQTKELEKQRKALNEYKGAWDFERVVGTLFDPSGLGERRGKAIAEAETGIRKLELATGVTQLSDQDKLIREVLQTSGATEAQRFAEKTYGGEQTAQVVSPTESLSRSIDEKIEKSKTEITVKAAPGTSAEITSQKGTSSGLTLQTSGGI